MISSLSDSELVHRLQLLQSTGSAAAAAAKAGVKASAFRSSIRDAKARGITATTKLTQTEDVLRTKVKVLEREIAGIRRDNVTAETVRSQLYQLAALTPDPPRWLDKPGKNGSPGVPVTVWSDFHWGEKVSLAETGGGNKFNRVIAIERLRRLVTKTISLCTAHMVEPNYPGIVVCLGGDIISGDIHEELRDTNDGYVQQSLLEVQEELITALSKMADAFGRVFVPCVVGNHGRMTHKPRMKGRVFTSYEYNLYCQLERHFKHDKRIQFSIPSETDAFFSVLGHRFMLTHGDTLGVKGGDGIIGAIGPIVRGTTKLGRSEAQLGRDFDTLLMGHWHTYIPRSEACPVIVNGTLKGYDEYARLGLRVAYSRPSQALFFVHKEYGVTAQWQIYLEPKAKSHQSSEWCKFERRLH